MLQIYHHLIVPLVLILVELLVQHSLPSLTEKEYHEAVEKYGYGSFKAEMGAEALEKLLREIDLEKLSESLKKELEKVYYFF